MNTPDSAAAGGFRVGHVAVVGRPNVGKSTLINSLVGFRVSIVSRRPQTTRHRILGISTFEGGQIVYVDTPGLHGKEPRAINRYMNRAARGALSEVQIGVLVVEAGAWREDDERAYKALVEAGVPRVLVINKVDKLKDKGALLPFIQQVMKDHDFIEVVPLSAQKRKGLEVLQKVLLKHLPEGEPLFEEDQVTDRSERFLCAELIREQLMRKLGDELPYATSVEIENWEEDGRMARIAAVIWVERDGQKAIVIGAGGEQLRQIGMDARIAMERLLDRKVFLQLWCKVREGWSDDEQVLQRFGYTE
ncbi:GTPase Era [Aquimonas voraii]|uniref:GTPase Era n=1 Tax=Aquimonas voraii TaxID=265719 RepID=A0A1G6SRW9_9GAMM|nr:GTPase Era [Aquimonas voraii]SDD19528.1 GTP-binding protein Era [Aquimonas voraii]